MQAGKYFCISTKSRNGKWRDHFFTRSKFSRVKSFIDTNLDKDLYWCPHGFSKAERKKEFAELPSLLWADLDEADPRTMKPRPSIAWESSPGRYACLWRLTGIMTEEVNRRLTYAVDADPGGWDLTQVLRIPGTRNYKYPTAPRVRLLWMDGPEYGLEDIRKLLPTEPSEAKGNKSLYRKYEKSLSAWARKALMGGKVEKGKRSEVLWKLTHELLEAGATSEEIFELIKASPWNKFKGRDREDEQLRREIDKATLTKMVVREESTNGSDYKWLARSMADVEAEKIDWVWYPYLARGEVTILEGDPGLGKSYVAHMMAKAIVDGEKLPSTKKLPPVQGKVVYFDIENSMGSVTKRRLLDNQCNKLDAFFQEDHPFSIQDEDSIDTIYDAIERIRPTLVVFDTLNTYIGATDTHHGVQAQQAFAGFIDIARRFSCSVLVLRHLTKSGKERAIYRGQGSIAMTGLARIVMTLGVSPEDEDVRVLGMTKLNFAPHPRALTFTIEELPDTLGYSDRSRFVWGDYSDWSSEDILSRPENDSGAMAEAVKFLREFLADGPVESTAVYTAAEPRGIAERTLRRAASKLRVVKSQSGFGLEKISHWSLPE